MHAILSIYHRKCSCQRNLKVRLIFLLFIEAVTIHRFTAADIPANAIIPFNQLFAFALIVYSRATSTATLANDFPVLLTLKPPSVKIFCRGIQGHPTSIIVMVCHEKYGYHFKKRK